MLNQFPYRLYTNKLFCRKCKRVVSHGVYAREKYSTYGGMDAHIPLLCCCDICRTLFIAFSHEFSFCKQELVNKDYAKIYGKNRIMPNNWIYFKGSPKPAKVKSVFQAPTKEILIISYDDCTEKKIELEKAIIDSERAPNGYRLLPAQNSVALIGDPIYHVLRDKFGFVAGLVNDGEKDKLAILLENNTIVFSTLPQSAQNLPNDKLNNIIQNKLKQLFPDAFSKISIEVGRGIVFLNGNVNNLSIKRAITTCINNMPNVRGCVDFTRIITDVYVTDSQLEKDINELLFTKALQLYNYSVSVNSGCIKVSANSNNKNAATELENRIGELAGVKDLECNITYEPCMINATQCKELEFDLATNSLLQGAKIKVSFANKKFILEGSVRTTIQKQIALLSLLKKMKTTAVENRLKQV